MVFCKIYTVRRVRRKFFVSYNDLTINDESNIKYQVFFNFLKIFGFLMKGKLISTESTLCCSRCKIHRYVAAILNITGREEILSTFIKLFQISQNTVDNCLYSIYTLFDERIHTYCSVPIGLIFYRERAL